MSGSVERSIADTMRTLEWTELPMWRGTSMLSLAAILAAIDVVPTWWIIGYYEGMGAGWRDLDQLTFEERARTAGVVLTSSEIREFAAGQVQTVDATMMAVDPVLPRAHTVDRQVIRHRIAGVQAYDSGLWRVGVRSHELAEAVKELPDRR